MYGLLWFLICSLTWRNIRLRLRIMLVSTWIICPLPGEAVAETVLDDDRPPLEEADDPPEVCPPVVALLPDVLLPALVRPVVPAPAALDAERLGDPAEGARR